MPEKAVLNRNKYMHMSNNASLLIFGQRFRPFMPIQMFKILCLQAIIIIDLIEKEIVSQVRFMVTWQLKQCCTIEILL